MHLPRHQRKTKPNQNQKPVSSLGKTNTKSWLFQGWVWLRSMFGYCSNFRMQNPPRKKEFLPPRGPLHSSDDTPSLAPRSGCGSSAPLPAHCHTWVSFSGDVTRTLHTTLLIPEHSTDALPFCPPAVRVHLSTPSAFTTRLFVEWIHECAGGALFDQRSPRLAFLEWAARFILFVSFLVFPFALMF